MFYFSYKKQGCIKKAKPANDGIPSRKLTLKSFKKTEIPESSDSEKEWIESGDSLDDISTEEREHDSEDDEFSLEENCDFSVGDFVLVEFQTKVTQYYIGLVIQTENTDVLIRFLRKGKISFVFPEQNDEHYVERCRVKKVLPQPVVRRGLHSFGINFKKLKVM